MQDIAIVSIVFLSITLVIGTYLLTRHRERTLIIEKGLTPEEIRALAGEGSFRTNPLSSLKWGMVFIGVGLAALTGIWLHEMFMMHGGVIPGLIALFGGIGLVVFYVVADRKTRSTPH